MGAQSENGQKMRRDINSIIMILATQCMINLGEIQDPVFKKVKQDMAGAKLFIDLLEVIEAKTKGNLDEEEDKFLQGVLVNLRKIYEKNMSGT